MPKPIDRNIASQIASIRAALRTRMDGSVAQSMRQAGLSYRYNWGWTRGYLVELAERYIPSRPLAEALRETDVRELLILSTMLFPPEALTQQDLETFLEMATNGELREQLAFNLLAHSALAVEWAKRMVSDVLVPEGTLYVALLTLANYAKQHSDFPLTASLHSDLVRQVKSEDAPISCRRVAYDLLITLEDSVNDES